MLVPTKYASEETLVTATRTLAHSTERCVPGSFGCVLFALVHLLLELFCLLLIDKGQPSETIFCFK